MSLSGIPGLGSDLLVSLVVENLLAGPSSGSWQLSTYLIGDYDGDHQVTREDGLAIRSIYGATATAGDGNYRLEADADLDGRITSLDYSYWRANIHDAMRQPLRLERVRIPATPASKPVAGEVIVADALTHQQLLPSLDAAVAAWEAAGIGERQRQQLRSVRVEVRDLSGDRLGLATRDTIWIHRDAAGLGWRIPGETAPPRSEPFAGVDLIAVLAHELGHVLGLPDLDRAIHPDRLMADTLRPGERRWPTAADLDRALRQEAARWTGPPSQLDEVLDVITGAR